MMDGKRIKQFSILPYRIFFKMNLYLIVLIAIILISVKSAYLQTVEILDKNDQFNWIQTARVFLMDAYQPPFAPKLEYDAKSLVETMLDMNANIVRLATMGKYATIQGVRFPVHPDQGNRDLLTETIEACKPNGIKVIPYISTGHKLAWSIVTEKYPEYAQKATPNGLPARDHMYVGEDHGTVCWMTPYREAFMDLVEHVVRDYDIDGIYFDKWETHYFWPGKKLCYCDGCRNGFREATGLEIPYHESNRDYTAEELVAIDKYHAWYQEEYITKVVMKVRELVKSYKDIPLISNINNPVKMAALDPRIINAMDAFLYERGNTILERAEGASAARSLGLHIWPYIGVYHNWPRLAFQGYNYQQQIFTNLMFGGGAIIAQPTGYITQSEYRKYVRYPFGVIKEHEQELEGMKNLPYVGVVFAYRSPEAYVKTSWHEGPVTARTSALGAFAACLYNHIQTSSVSEFVLDDPQKLEKYPILYLANIPYLSDRRIKNIHNYVENGGNLIVSAATTLYDEDGNRLNRFGLEKLVRARPINPTGKLGEIIKSYQAMIGGPDDLYLLAHPENNATIENERQNDIYPLWFYEPVEVLEGGKVLMDIITGPDNNPILPGVIMSEYGKGRVIYCASALESLYEGCGAKMIGDLINSFVKTVSTKPDPYTLDAPASLIANLTEKEDRLILHLTNWTGDKFEQPWRNEYYLAPVENVSLKIHIPEGKEIQHVYTLVKTDFKQQTEGQYLEVFFPKVEAYQAIVLEF